MSKQRIQPEISRTDVEFLLDLADLYLLAAQVEDAAPNQADVGEPASEPGFMEWHRRYQILDGVAEFPCTRVPDVGSLEMPSFEQMWAEA